MIIENSIKNATHVTHGGVFHADEVMATAICVVRDYIRSHTVGKSNMPLRSFVEYDDGIKLYRCVNTEELKDIKEDTIIFDIGGGRFDHHSPSKLYRSNGIPYASAGLLWKEYGNEICQAYGLNTPWSVDAAIIEGIDARDNGVKIMTLIPNKLDHNGDYIGNHITPYTFSDMVIDMNPTADKALAEENVASAFIDAVILACQMLVTIINKMSFNDRHMHIVETAIRNPAHRKVIVLPFYIPWDGILNNMRQHPDEDGNDFMQIKAAVFPSLRGGYQWVLEKGLTIDVNTLSKYANLKKDELREYFAGALFIHPSGFTGGAETAEAAVDMVVGLLKGDE